MPLHGPVLSKHDALLSRIVHLRTQKTCCGRRALTSRASSMRSSLQCKECHRLIRYLKTLAWCVSLVLAVCVPQAVAAPPAWPAVSEVERGPACANLVEGRDGLTASEVAVNELLIEVSLVAPSCQQVAYTAYLTTSTWAGDGPPPSDQVLAQAVVFKTRDQLRLQWRMSGPVPLGSRIYVTSSIGKRVLDVAYKELNCLRGPTGLVCGGLHFR